MIAKMRKQPQLQSTPVIVLSAKADEELMVRLLDDGGHDFIVKPRALHLIAVTGYGQDSDRRRTRAQVLTITSSSRSI